MATSFYEDSMERKRRMLPFSLGLQSPGGVLTQNVQPGQAPAPAAALPRSMEIRRRIAELEGSQAEDDGGLSMLAALAAEHAGESFAPIQAQYLKRAAASSPQARTQAQLARLMREAEIADRQEGAQQLQAERLAAQQQAEAERRAAAAERAAQSDQLRRELAGQTNETRRMLAGQSMDLRRELASGRAADAAKPPTGYRFTPEGNLQAIPGGPADTKIQGVLNTDTAALSASENALNMLERAANEVKTHPGLPAATGLLGAIPNLPGSNASNAQAKLEQLRSQVGFAVLQAMRDASKTGGALGNVSNFEVQALQNNLAALQKAQSTDQIKAELDKLMEWSSGAKDRLRSAYNMKHSGAAPTAPAAEQPRKRIRFDAQGNEIK